MARKIKSGISAMIAWPIVASGPVSRETGRVGNPGRRLGLGCFRHPRPRRRRTRTPTVLPGGLDQLDILLQQLVDELANLDAFGLGAGG